MSQQDLYIKVGIELKEPCLFIFFSITENACIVRDKWVHKERIKTAWFYTIMQEGVVRVGICASSFDE